MINRWLSTIMLIFCLNLSLPIEASAPDTTKSVILTVVNHLSLEDLRQMERLPDGDWLRRGAIGGMNLRTAGKMNDVNNAVTIGSGARAIGSQSVVESFMGREERNGAPVSVWYEQLTGRTVSPDEIVVPYFNEIKNSNQSSSFTMMPGLFGDTLRQHNVRVATLGNSDAGDKFVRFGPLIAMDQHGFIEGGDISARTLKRDRDRVYGVATDYEYLLTKMIEYDRSSSLIVVELGDLYRLSTAKDLMDARRYEAMKETILTEMNRFMKTVLANQDDERMVLLLAPMVSQEAERNRSMLAPFVKITPEHIGGTLNTSTTRQPNIVANVDIAPTILHLLDIPIPSEMMGRPISIDQTAQGEAEFWNDWDRIKHVYATRSDVLTSYVSFQIAILIIATAFWYFGKPDHALYRTGNLILRVLLVLIALSPFLLLMLPLFPVISDARLIVVILFLLGIAIAASLIRLSFPLIFLIVSFLNWFPILLDGIVWGAMLMKRSYLGYDAIIGARYYGIGNEYMGVAIGSAILSIAMLMELTKGRAKWIKPVTVSIFGSYLLFFALPKWGANAGGAISAAVAYSASFVCFFKVRLHRSAMLAGAGGIVILLAVLFWVNTLAADQTQSHIGRAMTKLMQGDLLEIGNIIQRKLEMNWKLIGVSAWSKVFITSILLLGFICYRPFGMIQKFSDAYPYVIRGFLGIVIGAFTALLVNDSGIIAAATTIIYMIVPMLFLGLKERIEPLD